MTKAENIHISPAPIVNAGRIFKETLTVARSGLFSSVIICGTPQPGLPRQEDLTYGRRIERVEVPCTTLRSWTVWPETLPGGSNALGGEPQDLSAAVSRPQPTGPPPMLYGDGATAERDAEELGSWEPEGGLPG